MFPVSRSKRRRMRIPLIAPSFQVAEVLEGRVLLSTINWSNRFTTSDSDPKDNRFDNVFGTSANQAYAVVEAAIDAWERTIINFNYGNSTVYDLTVQMNATAIGSGAGRVGANAGFSATVNNKPSVGSMGIGWRSGLPLTNNEMAGWYLDPSPNDSSEYTSHINAFSAERSAGQNSLDLFTVVLHELGHAMGLAATAQTTPYAQDTGVADTVNTPASTPASNLWLFSNGSLWTAWDSGGASPNPTNNNGPQHFAPAGTSAVVNGITYYGATALMNAVNNGWRCLISDLEANAVGVAYGYTIDPPSNYGTMYNRLNADGTLRINTAVLGASNDFVDVRINGSNMSVVVTPGSRVPGIDPVQIFSNYPLSAVSTITIDTGDGNDFVRVLSNGNRPVTVTGGSGADTLELHGAAGGYDNFVRGVSTFSGSGLNIQSLSSWELMRIWTEGGGADISLPFSGSTNAYEVIGDSSSETVNLHTLASGTPMTMFLGSGADVINVQVDGGVGLIGSALTINGGDGNDIVNVGPVGFASTIVTQPITFNGDNDEDSFVLGSNNADSVAATMTFNGNSGFNDRIIINDQAPSYNIDYDIRPTVINRVGFNTYDINYFNTDRITINGGNGADDVVVRNGVAPTVEAFGNDGPDNFTRGDGFITASSVANFNGGNGIDQITFDDHLNTANIIFDCKSGEVLYGGLVSQLTTGFETVGVLAGSGQNEITFAQTLTQNFNIDAGAGNDTIILGFLTSVVFQGNVSINGGDGADSFQINNASTSIDASLALNGGNDQNSIAVNRPGTLQYDIGTSFLNMYSLGTRAVIGMGNIESGSITGNPLSETFNIFSAPSLFVPFSISGNAGNDQFVCLQPSGSDFTFDNLVLSGGADTDTFTYNATAATGPQTLNVAFGSLSIPRGIVSDDISFGSTIENVTLLGGSGDETFNINQFSTGANLRINGGDGNDHLHMGNGNLQANLTNAASFNYDGQGGYDTFSIDNALNTRSWTYTSNAASIISQSLSPAPSYSWTAGIAGLEVVNINAGSNADVLALNAVPEGESIYFFAGGGNDSLTYIGDTSQIRGIAYFYADGGTRNTENTGDSITNIFNSNNLGQTVHLMQDSLGAMPGDTYWGPGGALYFYGVEDILLTMGSGDDVVYAQPNTTASVTIRGSGQATADTLNLALAAAGTYSIDPGAAGSFDLTSSLAQMLNFSGFEAIPAIDDVAPDVLSGDFLWDAPQQSLSFAFSEDVGIGFSTAYLALTNSDTNELVPYANMASAYDVLTNIGSITFPGYVNGALPDGNYHATLVAGVPDLFGNLSTTTLDLNFFVLAGDINHDRSVNFDDLLTVAQNYGLSDQTFSQGNIDYSPDGLVGFDDLLILAQRYGTSLVQAEVPTKARKRDSLQDGLIV